MPENRKSGAKRLLMMFGLFLLCVASAYGYGRWQGAKVVAGVQAAVAGERDSAVARVGQARSELTDLRGQVQLLQARRHLDRALMAIDERNFGTATDALHTAGGELAAIQTPPSGADPAVLSRLAQELQSVRLVVAENFSEQRGRIMGWIRELDAQFPADPVASAATSTIPEGSNPSGEPAPTTVPGSETSTAPAAPPIGPR